MKRESIVVLPGLTNTIDRKDNRKDKKGNWNKVLKLKLVRLKLNRFLQLGEMYYIGFTLSHEFIITEMDRVARK